THALAEVAPEGALRGLEQHEPVLRLVDLVAHAVAHAGGARRAPPVAVRLVAGHLVLGALVGLPGLAAVPVHRRGRIRLRDLEAAALTGGAGADDPGQDAEGAEQRSGVNPDRRVLG